MHAKDTNHLKDIPSFALIRGHAATLRAEECKVWLTRDDPTFAGRELCAVVVF
jgi:hypothetical protein